MLRCHYDRTKRIATENSPYLFLTVSEDGSVRQHDLRRPHSCRSECPEPLFRAPRGVDLYSLSVSTVTPHIFAVAGRTDCVSQPILPFLLQTHSQAFVCDRRMTERQTPSWGNRTKTSGQVNCVRRLGLTNEQWESMGVTNRGPFSEDRHITCVKMSPEHAEEVRPNIFPHWCGAKIKGHLCFCATFHIAVLTVRLARLGVYASSLFFRLRQLERQTSFEQVAETTRKQQIHGIRL